MTDLRALTLPSLPKMRPHFTPPPTALRKFKHLSTADGVRGHGEAITTRQKRSQLERASTRRDPLWPKDLDRAAHHDRSFPYPTDPEKRALGLRNAFGFGSTRSCPLQPDLELRNNKTVKIGTGV